MILNPTTGNSLEKAISQTVKHHMNNKLFVGNLSFNTTENDLQDAFAAHGTVVEANLMMDRGTGRPRGFGFVTMSTAEEAQKAAEAMNGKDMDGRALTVNIARPREERSGAAAVVVVNIAAVAIATNPAQGFHGGVWLIRTPPFLLLVSVVGSSAVKKQGLEA